MAEFEFVPHTADIALRVRGRDLPTLLRRAALGLSAAVADREELTPRRAPGVAARPIQSDGAPDEEGILVTFLNELIFLGDTEREVYSDVEVEGWSLDGGVRALAYPDPELEAVHSVKAATYYDLRIEREGEDLTATIVFDV